MPPAKPSLTYYYDGTPEGWLCCVYESYMRKEIPWNITAGKAGAGSCVDLLSVPETIVTDWTAARRVRESIKNKLGNFFWQTLEKSFYTCQPEKELQMLLLTRKGFRYGPEVLLLTEDPVVRRIQKGLCFLGTEVDKWRGFVRFTDIRGVLVSVIGAKNCVLPFIASHFCHRFCQEHFLIYDEKHHMALVHRPGKSAIIPMDGLSPREPSEEEERYRSMWKLYYDAIEIHPRHNAVCRRTHMPKWYWDYLTEMSGRTSGEPVAPAAGKPYNITDGPAGTRDGKNANHRSAVDYEHFFI